MTLLLALACSNPEPPPPPPPEPVVQVPAPPPAPAPLPPDFVAPPILAFGVAELWRRAKDEIAANDGQFDHFEVRVGWPLRAEDPAAGVALTVLPLATLPPVETTILEARKVSEPELGDAWELALPTLTEPSWLQAPANAGRRPEFPFEAVFLVPPQPQAKVMELALVPLGDLPPDARPTEVLAAVDVNADGRPDAVALSFCCAEERPKGLPLAGCDYHCGELWVMREGDWVKLDSSQPM